MVNIEYAKAYKEVLEILKYIPKSDLNKIPTEEIEFYKKHMNKEYVFEIDEKKEFQEQIISDITKAILANIFRDYWATEYQKEKIILKEKSDIERLEIENKKKYDIDNIFKNKEKNKDLDLDSNIDKEIPNIADKPENNALIEYKKENWYIKFINYMKNIFKRNK